MTKSPAYDRDERGVFPHIDQPTLFAQGKDNDMNLDFEKWQVFSSSRSGPRTPYTDDHSIYVAPYGAIIMTHKLHETMGRPAKIQIRTDGRDYAFMPVGENETTGYTVYQHKERNASPRFTCKSFLASSGLIVPGYLVSYPVVPFGQNLLLDGKVKPNIIRKHDTVSKPGLRKSKDNGK